LFEECVASAAEWQRGKMVKHDDAIEQIRVFLTSQWSNQLSPQVVRALALYNLTLSAMRPSDLAHALEPQLNVLHEAVERGVATGQIRDDIDARRLSEILFHTATAAVNTTILQTGSESPADVWSFCLGGIRKQG